MNSDEFKDHPALKDHSNFRIVEVNDGEKSLFYPICCYKDRTIRATVQTYEFPKRWLYRVNTYQEALNVIHRYKKQVVEEYEKKLRKYVKVHEVP